MDNKEATRVCDLCNKEVAEANFALHETHCRRFLCLCPDCDEPVPREQLNQHRLDQHSQVRCSKCEQKVERCHLMDHESDECEERLQCCQFCQLEVPWRGLGEHSEACGSRTERCLDCDRYVTLKDQPEHGRTCPAANPGLAFPHTDSGAPSKSQISVICRGCMAYFPGEDIEEHEMECVPASRLDLKEAEKEKEEAEEEEEEEEEEGDLYREAVSSRLSSSLKAASLSDRASRGPWGDRGDPHQISTCPHCHLALPLITLRWHEVKCQIHVHMK